LLEVPAVNTSSGGSRSICEGNEFEGPMGPYLTVPISPNTASRPILKRKVTIGSTEPRHEPVIGMMDVRRKMAKNPSGN